MPENQTTGPAPRKIVFEVDPTRLFDALSKMNGDTAPLGARLVETLLSPPGFRVALGLAMYGITLAGES